MSSPPSLSPNLPSDSGGVDLDQLDSPSLRRAIGSIYRLCPAAASSDASERVPQPGSADVLGAFFCTFPDAPPEPEPREPWPPGVVRARLAGNENSGSATPKGAYAGNPALCPSRFPPRLRELSDADGGDHVERVRSLDLVFSLAGHRSPRAGWSAGGRMA